MSGQRSSSGKVCAICQAPIGLGEPFYTGTGIHRDVHKHTRCVARQEGAAVAFGLMGMAAALVARQRWKDYEDRMLEEDMGQ